MARRPDDKPVSGRATTLADLRTIIEHPAFRVGFLDAQEGRPHDSADILRRIAVETPEPSLRRVAWPWTGGSEDLLTLAVPELDAKVAENRQKAVALAQYRYEEGRRLVVEFGLHCKGWKHPDRVPSPVLTFLIAEAERRSSPKGGG